MNFKIQNLISMFPAFIVGIMVYVLFSIVYFYNGIFSTFFVLPIYAILSSFLFVSVAIFIRFLLKKKIYKIKHIKKVSIYVFFIGLIFLFLSPFFGIVSKYVDYEAHQDFLGPNLIVSSIAYFLIIFSVLNFFNKKQNEN